MTKNQISQLMLEKGYRDTNEKLVHTSPGTFAVVKKKSFGPPSNPQNDNRGNRAQTLWKMSEHVIIEDVVTNETVWDGHSTDISEKQQVLDSWKLVTSKDPDLESNMQRLYLSQDGQIYEQYDSKGNMLSQGTLDLLIGASKSQSANIMAVGGASG